MMERECIRIGERFIICALRTREGRPTLYEEFLRGLDRAAQGKLVKAVARLADHGPPRNREKCRPIKGSTNLYELKEYQSRIFWFYSMEPSCEDRSVIVLPHGFTKKSDRTPVTEIERAEALKREYFETFLGDRR